MRAWRIVHLGRTSARPHVVGARNTAFVAELPRTCHVRRGPLGGDGGRPAHALGGRPPASGTRTPMRTPCVTAGPAVFPRQLVELAHDRRNDGYRVSLPRRDRRRTPVARRAVPPRVGVSSQARCLAHGGVAGSRRSPMATAFSHRRVALQVRRPRRSPAGTVCVEGARADPPTSPQDGLDPRPLVRVGRGAHTRRGLHRVAGGTRHHLSPPHLQAVKLWLIGPAGEAEQWRAHTPPLTDEVHPLFFPAASPGPLVTSVPRRRSDPDAQPRRS